MTATLTKKPTDSAKALRSKGYPVREMLMEGAQLIGQLTDEKRLERITGARGARAVASVGNLGRRFRGRWGILLAIQLGADAFEILEDARLEAEQRLGRPIPVEEWLQNATFRFRVLNGEVVLLTQEDHEIAEGFRKAVR